MGVKNLDIYVKGDEAIMAMNRENLKAFSQLKLMKFDELNVVRNVTNVYRESVKKARRHYYEEAFDVYILILLTLGVDSKKAHRMAEKVITMDWVDQRLEETDPVTLYVFTTEAERKAQRLIEALSATQARNAEIDKALRIWSRQVGQFAISMTDEAVKQAFADMDVPNVMWMTALDERVCEECAALNGLVFPLDEVPAKPHIGCRCRIVPTD